MDWPLIVSSALSLVLYLNTLNANFAYDDSRAIQKNPDLLPETPLVNVFYDDFWGTPLTHSGSHKSYRPLCVLTFRLNYMLGGLHPLGYHLGNILLHAVVTGLFVHVARHFLNNDMSRWVAGLLFASHPIHTEAVAGIVGRADIGACMFFLLALECYIAYCRTRDSNMGPGVCKWMFLALSGLLTGASMFTKEQGVTVLGICAVYDALIHTRLRLQDLASLTNKTKYRRMCEGLLFITLFGCFLVAARLYFMGNKPPEFAPADNPASDSDSLLTRSLTFWYLPVVNFWLMLCPRVLSFDWSMEAIPLLESLVDHRNIFTLAFYVGLTFISSKILNQSLNLDLRSSRIQPTNGHLHKQPSHHHHHRNGNGHFSYHKALTQAASVSSDTACQLNQKCLSTDVLIISTSLMVLPFIPATNIFFYVGFVVAERVLYIPSMGLCLLVAQGALILHRRAVRAHKTLLYNGVVALLLICFCVKTVQRNNDWFSEENLYTAGITVNPPKAWGNLANIFNNQGRVKEAENAYKSALRHRGNMADVHYNLGILLQDQKRYKEAIESYKLAIQCRPRLTLAHLNLGIVLGVLNQHHEAEKTYKECAGIDITGLKDPRLHESTKVSCLYNLGRVYADLGRFQDAVFTYKDAIEKMPSHYQPQSLYNMLGESYFKLGNLNEAERWYLKALEAKNDHIPAYLTLAKLYHTQNFVEKAEFHYKRALQIDTQSSSVAQHYGQFLSDLNRHDDAADLFVRVTQRSYNDFDLTFTAANVMRQAGRNSEAEVYYQKAVNLRPDMATAHMNLGAMLHFNGKYIDAERSYLTALQLKPDDTITSGNLQKLRNLMKSKRIKTSNGAKR